MVFLHVDGDDHQARRLATATRSSTTTVSISPLTEFQISNYQITLWTAVFFIMLIYAAVYMVADMEVIPDSLLFAKFQSSRTGGRAD